MTRPALGSCVHLFAVLLVFEHDSDICCGSEQVRVGVVDDAACSSAEDDAAKADSLCPSWACGLGVFTRSDGKEVCAKCDVGRLGVGGVLD